MNTTARTAAILAGLALTIAGAGDGMPPPGQPPNQTTTVDGMPVHGQPPATVVTSGDGAAGSGEPQTVRVAGRQIPVDIDDGLYEMRGSLVGDWHYMPKKVLHNKPTLYVESGVEVFNGCIDRRPTDGKCTGRDHRGELHLAFLYWASFDRGGDLIKGRCVHPITGGKGAFAGARGLLKMVDRPVGNRVKTTYRGRIVLNAVPTDGDADTPLPSSIAGTVADQQTSAISVRRAC